MHGGLTAKPSAVAPMPGVLGDKSSSSEGEGSGVGDASPPKDEEADSADHHRPMVVPTMEVSEDEVEARSPAARFQSVAFQAAAHRTEDAGAADAVLSPLYLSEWPFDSCCDWLFPFSFT